MKAKAKEHFVFFNVIPPPPNIAELKRAEQCRKKKLKKLFSRNSLAVESFSICGLDCDESAFRIFICMSVANT